MIKRGIKTGFLSVGRVLLDLLLPPKCLRCHVRVGDADSICPDCWKGLHFISDPKCRCCGYPFGIDSTLNLNELGETLCGQCQKVDRSFDKAVSALRYDDDSRQLIISFKHNDRLEYVGFFTKLLMQAGADLLNDTDLIVPVPLHKRRLLERRYNQSALLSRSLSRKLSIPHEPSLLVRKKNTPPQKGNINKRSINVRGAFKVGPGNEAKIKGASILLIDDVYTTGATIENCAKILKKAGADKVDVLTLLRVISPQNPN